MFAGLACTLALRIVLKRANVRLDKLVAETNPDDAEAVARLDDDSQRAVMKGFRYVI